MNSKVYKWCMVPLCKNTSIATPNKVFVYVPNKKIVRDKWLQLAWRNPADVVTTSSIYFCEDHFDLPNDMENYMQYHLMGSVSQVRMKPGCAPKKFACQPGRKTQTSDTIERPYTQKKRRVMVLEECEKQLGENIHFEEIGSGKSGKSQQRHYLKAGTISSIFMCNKKSSIPASRALRHKKRLKCQMEYTVDDNTASRMETLPCSEETLTEQCRKMIYNVFAYLKLNHKHELGKPLTMTGLIELTSEVTGISRGKVEEIVCDNEGREGIVKDELDIGPVELYKPLPSSIKAQEMAEPVVVKQEPELHEEVPLLGSPETQQVDAGPLGLLLPVKLEPDFIKQEIDIGPTVLYKPQL